MCPINLALRAKTMVLAHAAARTFNRLVAFATCGAKPRHRKIGKEIAEPLLTKVLMNPAAMPPTRSKMDWVIQPFSQHGYAEGQRKQGNLWVGVGLGVVDPLHRHNRFGLCRLGPSPQSGSGYGDDLRQIGQLRHHLFGEQLQRHQHFLTRFPVIDQH